MSYLPDFCVPYKHYGADTICRVLSLLLLVGRTVKELSDPFGDLNEVGHSSWCVRNWLDQFKRNSHNLWTSGMVRLTNVSPAARGDPTVSGNDLTALMRVLHRVAIKHTPNDRHVFPFCQVKLCSQLPPFGLFRAMLLQGCAT